MKTKAISPLPLDPATVPLYGRHLIEASAGTGKTFNITRIYLRLLLENNALLKRPLRVQEILVMTFTKAATEELRGRLEQELRAALAGWGKASERQEPFFITLESRAAADRINARSLIESALLELDEAAVFTIHGFCHRVLSQESFASGLPMELAMEADTADLLTTAVQDWFRKINQNSADFLLLEGKSWHTPDAFIAGFNEVLKSEDELICHPNQQFVNDHPQRFANIASRKTDLRTRLLENEELIETDFISRLEKYQERRQLAWESAQQWLAKADDTVCDDRVRLILQGTGAKTKPIKALLEPIKQLIEDTDELLAVQVNELVIRGIQWIRQRFKALKVQRSVVDYSDLILHLSQRLQADDGAALIKLLRQQYPVALVDEFQDTDAQQYAIFDSIYPKVAEGAQGGGENLPAGQNSLFYKSHALFMIGDPKQAIYGFRGGDIFAYLSAREQKDYGWQLATNWRSSRGVVAACNRIFWGGALTEMPQDLFRYGIDYHQTVPSQYAERIRLHDPDSHRSHINLAWMPEIEYPSGKTGPVKEDWIHGLARWCVAEIDRLLHQASITDGQQKLSVQQKDIAVLVRTASEAGVIRSCLQQVGLSSVYLSDRTQVFASDQAQELMVALQGILEVENEAFLIAALSTRLLGGHSEKLAGFRQPDGEQLWEESRIWVMGLRHKWLHQGCLALVLELVQHSYQPPPSERERALTNMLQLAELLQKASKRHSKPQELLKWFRDQCRHPVAAEEAEQRLESDARLIRVITLHGCKGLEYPIVFVPFACSYRDPAKANNKKLACYKFHRPENNVLQYQVGHSDIAEQLLKQEGHAESVRLLYVGITRAALRCYLGAAPFGLKNSSAYLSSLGLVLGIAEKAGADGWQKKLDYLQDTANDTIRVIAIGSATRLPSARVANEPAATGIQATAFKGRIDDRWRLASYSALAKRVKSARIDANDHLDDKESSQQQNSVPADLPLRFTLKKGIKAGDLLHAALEHTDFTDPDWPASLAEPLRLFDNQASSDTRQALTDWLEECLQCPIPLLRGRLPDFKLAELTPDKTLREAEFYFPMEKLHKHDLEKLLVQHRGGQSRGGHNGGLHGGDKTLSFSGDEQSRMLTGMMHGYIDLIFERNGQFFVCDYKSTYLGNRFADYNQAAIMENMQSHFYDLQYLIYALALHRYLQLRLGDRYDPERHFGGVYYFYLRGMSPHSDLPYSGIYHRAISSAELTELGQLFGAGVGEVAS